MIIKNSIPILLIILTFASCNEKTSSSSSSFQNLEKGNIFSEITSENLGDLTWLNKPTAFSIDHNSLKVEVTKGTDFFNNPEDGQITSTAPYLYKEMNGDFVAIAVVQPDFSSMWNAVALMVQIDSLHWIKFGFENSDATGPGIVSVVTKNVSDDSNGVILNNQDKVWLKLIRKGNVFSMHWSMDGETYKMTRLTAMRPTDFLKIGIEAQCPVGESATHEIIYFGIVKETVSDLRKGE